MRNWLLLPLHLVVWAIDMVDLVEDTVERFVGELADACGRADW